MGAQQDKLQVRWQTEAVTGAARTLILLLAAALTACSTDSGRDELVVFGAASLTDALMMAELAFETANPEVDIKLNLAGSSSLREQVLGGARADVVIPANLGIMDELVERDEVDAGQISIVATNGLAIAVAPGNPGNIDSAADFARSEPFLGVCHPAVPCGSLAYEHFSARGITPSIDTEEPDVRALLTKVIEGELDAGIVYESDIVAADGAVDGILMDAPEVSYPAAVTERSSQPELADRFIAFLRSPDGQKIFTDVGFRQR
ncbi:MAG: molybdate ABC transporter substrate-binding protein [Acidimicrobiales bacterium]|nr:molybdate ABC transporter substrate-binding protein [Acidimicrobiales bacterium]